jgi:hypothetical protein
MRNDEDNEPLGFIFFTIFLLAACCVHCPLVTTESRWVTLRWVGERLRDRTLLEGGSIV